MPQFPDHWLQQLKANIDLTDIIKQRVALRPSGKNWVGLCPFHQEKTPSFTVFPETQSYHCFGCGQGGDVLHFVMETEQLSFQEAVETLAHRTGLALPNLTPDEKRRHAEREQLGQINALAARFFYEQLRGEAGYHARHYLVNRGITPPLAHAFYLGFAPERGTALQDLLRENGVDFKAAVKAGVLADGRHGPYPRFRNRIMFPILNHTGRCIGFGGRVMDDTQPKYLNTPETPLFRKGRTLYGLNLARNAIKEADAAILVEGYTDCISLHAKGLTNVVAALGTSFSPHHAALLRRWTQNAVIAFDGDTAGQAATLKGLHVLKEADIRVRVAHLAPGDDPDTFARKNSHADLANWIAEAVPLVEYQICQAAAARSADSREGRLEAARSIVAILAGLESAVEREEYLTFAAKYIGLNPQALAEEVAHARNSSTEPAADASPFEAHKIPKKRHTKKASVQNQQLGSPAERCVARWLSAKPELAAVVRKKGIAESDFENPRYGHLYRMLSEGVWDEAAKEVSAELERVPRPQVNLEEYLRCFQADIYHRKLVRMEEDLSSLANSIHKPEILAEISRLLQEYAAIRKNIAMLT